MRLNLILFFVFIESFGNMASAQSNGTIPIYHWVYSYLEELRLSGHLITLHPIRRPYTEVEVGNSLTILKRQLENGEITASAHERWMIDLLAREFLQHQRSVETERQLMIKPGVWMDEFMIHNAGTIHLYTQLRSRATVDLKDWLTFDNGVRLDQFLLEDPLYPGKRWRGFAGYTEQAYLRFRLFDRQSKHYHLGCRIGRDFLLWGSGKTKTLLFSDHAQPLDHILFDFQYKGLRFFMIAGQLEKWNLTDSLAKVHSTRRANRYLSAHGVTIAIKNRLFIGLTEALLYGGPDTSWELKYMNPMLYYHGELLNGGGSDGNGFLYLDFDFYPWPNWELYGEILVDDYQLEKKIPIDLEPNEYGFILGGQRSSVLGIPGNRLGIEYVRIANRTYNSWQNWEKFVHFNRTIGYSLGNNFDRWHFIASQWLWRGGQIRLAWDRIRQGTGSVLACWDTPWLKYTVAEGYDEPFPYGIVETSSSLTLTFRYHPRIFAFLESQARYSSIKNVDHLLGKNRHGWDFTVNLHLDFGTRWRY